MILAAVLFAATPGAVAMSLELPVTDRAAVVRSALTDGDAKVRAAAARIAAVTNDGSLLDDVRAALRKEMNAEAAREEIRVIGMSGGVNELDALLEQSKRFESKLDDAVWIAVARGSGPAVLDEWIARKSERYRVLDFALWGRPQLAAATASRLLGQGNPKSWRVWLQKLHDAGMELDSQAAAMALAHPNPEISGVTAWSLAQRYATAPPPNPKPMLEALDRESSAAAVTTIEHAFGRELLRRALGRKRIEREEWTKWAAEQDRYRLWLFARLLTPEEIKAAEIPNDVLTKGLKRDQPLPPLFDLLNDLPAGVAEGVLAETGCQPAWFGAAAVAVDAAGRVTALDLKGIGATAECTRALGVLLRTSLADGVTMGSAFSADNFTLVHRESSPLCLDEAPVMRGLDAMTPGVTTTAPKKLRGVAPAYSDASRQAHESGTVIVRVRISETGCVSSIRLLKSATPLLDASALTAVSQWQFAPALAGGIPVPISYNLTVNFKTD